MSISRRRGEEGTIIVLWALLIVVLLLMVAFAVDVGNLGQTRRQAQNAADTAALAAAQEIGLKQNLGITDAINAAKQKVDENYGIPPGSPLWSTCSDPDHLALPAGATTECISFDSVTNPTQVRVRVPGKTVQFTFARAAGFTSRDVSAAANAAIVTPQGGRLLPLAVSADAVGLQCLESGGGKGGGNQKVCSSPLASGDFGSLTSPRYRTFTSDDNSKDRDAVNFVVGIDHLLLVAGSDPQICDANSNTSGRGNKCAIWNDEIPRYDKGNWVWVDQGNQLKDPTTGLVGPKQDGYPAQWISDGGTKFTARLKRPDAADPNSPAPPPNPASPVITTQFGNKPFNGVHISKFLKEPTRSSCYPGRNPDTENIEDPDWENQNQCLDGILRGPFGAPIFTADIMKSPRFGFVPVVDSQALNGNSSPARILAIRAVYLDKLYESGNSVKAIRAWVFDPRLIEPSVVPGGGGSGFFGGPFSIKLIK